MSLGHVDISLIVVERRLKVTEPPLCGGSGSAPMMRCLQRGLHGLGGQPHRFGQVLLVAVVAFATAVDELAKSLGLP